MSATVIIIDDFICFTSLDEPLNSSVSVLCLGFNKTIGKTNYIITALKGIDKSIITLTEKDIYEPGLSELPELTKNDLSSVSYCHKYDYLNHCELAPKYLRYFKQFANCDIKIYKTDINIDFDEQFSLMVPGSINDTFKEFFIKELVNQSTRNNKFRKLFNICFMSLLDPNTLSEMSTTYNYIKKKDYNIDNSLNYLAAYTNNAHHKGISNLYCLFDETLDLTLNLLPFVIKTKYNIDHFDYNLQSILTTSTSIYYTNTVSKDVVKDIDGIIYRCDSSKLSEELINKYVSNAETINTIINEGIKNIPFSHTKYANMKTTTHQAGGKASIGKEQIDRIF